MAEIPALMAIAERQLNLGNLRAAIGPLREVLAADPEHPGAHAYLALCLAEPGQHWESEMEIQRALRLAPANANVQFAAGFLALRGREYGLAERHLEEVRRLAPQDGRSYRLLAQLCGILGRQDEILPILRDGLQHDPGNIGIVLDIGVLHFHAGDTEGAEARALQVLAVDPNDRGANVLMAEVRLRQRRVAEARTHALTALSRDANDPIALQVLCSAKASRNPLLALWWRSAIWVSRYDQRQIRRIGAAFSSVFLPVAGFFIMLGHAAPAVIYAVVMGYGWGCRYLYRRALAKELQSVQLQKDF
jgi:Flp pilus assembly protein TadD